LGLGHSVWRDTITTQDGGSGNLLAPDGGGTGGTGASGPNDASSIAAKVAPALVDIDTDLSYEDGEAAGTGIVLTSDGLVLTNNHVISEATQIKVTDIGNGQTYTGVVVGYDHTHDIALIQLAHASNLATAQIGDSANAGVGEQIVGIGNAGGVGGDPSAAGGAITALDQSITATDEADSSSEQLAGLIEVDADIEPGDSGGALVDTAAQVIGVDTAASAGFSFQSNGGQGFAIPINQALRIVHQIEAGQTTGSIHVGATAFLGVLVNPSGTGSGATLAKAVPGEPAAQAGLAKGDTITALGGQSVTSSSALTDLILRYHPGDKVQVQWVDTLGRSHQATVTLAQGPAQ
jgi:S1-C subfamily serine protease